jgi:hypothetical protein
LPSFAPVFAAPCAFFKRLSAVSTSESASSSSMMSISRIGSTEPDTWMTLGSSKQRTIIKTALVSRMFARNLLPRPSPCDAPLTSPAMSTISTIAGITFCVLMCFSIRARRGSGTGTTPTFGSIVQKG